jgi:hypothetical protein
MTAPAQLMKGHQQGHWEIFVEFLLVTGGTLAAFTEVPVVKHIKIMVTHPATKNGFVQIVVKSNLRLIVLTESFAFQVHDPFLRFLLGPCQGCGQDAHKNQSHNNIPMPHAPHPC